MIIRLILRPSCGWSKSFPTWTNNMADPLSITISTSRLHTKLESLRDALIGSGQDATNLVRDEAKHLSRTISKFIPPMGAGAKQVGEHAVETGIKAVFSEAQPTLI